jgi:hypothetical protein
LWIGCAQLAAAALGFATTVSADAQTMPIYRAHPLPPPSTSPGGSIVSRAFALNNQCDVVGEATGTLEGVTALHGTLWVPITRFGITGQTTKDLNQLFTDVVDKRRASRALDVNMSGQVAGRHGAEPTDVSDDGVIWQPGGTPQFVKLDGVTVIANAINNAGVAVGQRTFTHPSCGDGFLDGFRATWDSSGTPTLTSLLASDDLETDAQDINNNSTARTVGRRYPLGNPPTCQIARTPCQSTLDGAEWTGTGSPAVMTPLVTSTEDYAHGNNDENNSVGFSLRSLQTGCLDQATFRETATGTMPGPVNLHTDADPPLASDAESRAEAVNEPLDEGTQCLQVVGTQSVPEFRGQLWQRDDEGEWTRTDLNDLVWTGCGATPLYTVREAKDINDDGEIAVILDDPNIGGLTEIAGVLLSVADLTTDGNVDGGDNGILLLEWCDTGTCDPSPADFNCDGFVNGADLGILLLAWDKPVRPVCSAGEGAMGGSSQNPAIESILSPMFQEVLVALLAEGSVDAANSLIIDMMEGGGQ